jgi:hypothetical protein
MTRTMNGACFARLNASELLAVSLCLSGESPKDGVLAP